jgi:hypothetical protein
MHFAVVTILINLGWGETGYHDGFKMWNMVGTWSVREGGVKVTTNSRSCKTEGLRGQWSSSL